MCKQRQELERLCEKVGGCRVAKHKSGSGHFLMDKMLLMTLISGFCNRIAKEAISNAH